MTARRLRAVAAEPAPKQKVTGAHWLNREWFYNNARSHDTIDEFRKRMKERAEQAKKGRIA